MNLTILQGDAIEKLSELPAESVNCCVTSPPYFGLRDYGVDGQIGLEQTPDEYIAKLVDVFREVKRVLKEDGTLWVNIGDSYAHSVRQSGASYAGAKQNSNSGSIRDGFRRCPAGVKEKDLIGIPWMLAFALRADGWYLRQDIIWAKGTSGERREGNVMAGFRLTGRDSLCPDGASFVSTMPPSPSSVSDGLAAK